MRFFHRILAFLLGTFWTACPRCHVHFGGHQGIHHHVKIGDENYRFVCKNCFNNNFLTLPQTSGIKTGDQ